VTEPQNQAFFSAWSERLQALKNVPPVLRIVWDSGPHIVTLGLFFRVIASLIPVSTAYVSKLIIDTIQDIYYHKTTFGGSRAWNSPWPSPATLPED
jgi:ATP-binding cassette, subfamily B, bacterial